MHQRTHAPLAAVLPSHRDHQLTRELLRLLAIASRPIELPEQTIDTAGLILPVSVGNRGA